MEDRGHLDTEKPYGPSGQLDTLDASAICRLINEADASVPAAVGAAVPQVAALVEIVVQRLRRGGRLFYVGAGTSGRLGVLDAAECPPTFRAEPHQVQGIIAGGYDALVRSAEGAEDRPQGARWTPWPNATSGQMTWSSASPPAGPRRSSTRRWPTPVGVGRPRGSLPASRPIRRRRRRM